MSIPRPKILTVVTIPSGGWEVTLQYKVAVDYDTTTTFTMAAGDYFVSWDNQSDDFLQEFMAKAYTALQATGQSPYNLNDSRGKPTLHIDSDHKVNIDVRTTTLGIDWTATDGASVAAVLGFDSSAALQMTANSSNTATYQHGYGWYASEDGQLASDLRVDASLANVLQSTAPSGHIKTTFIDARFQNELDLRWLTSTDTFSNNKGYVTAPLDPYVRNKGLECWWTEARQGKRFRVYEDSTIDTTRAEVQGEATGTTSTSITDSSKAYGTDPQEHDEKLVLADQYNTAVATPMRWLISSHTATALTLANSVHNQAITGNTFWIFDQRYRTYVLDLNRMPEFRPLEMPNIDRYEITLPLLKYVS